LIVGGYSDSKISDQKTENSKGSYDYWIVKLDNNKAIQWDRTIGGNSADFIRSIQQTADGGYILGGNSYSDKSGDKTQNSKGLTDYWIVKLDANGNMQWDKTIGGSNYDDLMALQQTTDGGYILGGNSKSGIEGDKTKDSKGGFDYWIVKLDGGGNVQWQQVIGGDGDDNCEALQQTTDGGYFVGGFSHSDIWGDKTENSKGAHDYWVVKLDDNGVVQWDKTVGGNKFDILQDIKQTTDGGYILGGYSFSDKSGDKTENTKGNTDYWIVKLESEGNIQWDKTISGIYDDNLESLQQTTDGGYILSGHSYSSAAFDKTEDSRGGYDYWVVKTNSRGRVQWDKTIGGISSELSPVIREIKKNTYVVGGSSSSGISGDKTGGNRGIANGNYDYWLVELKYVKPDSTAITSIPHTGRVQVPLQNNNNSAFLIYPNPARDKINIQSVGKSIYTLTNGAGKTVAVQTIDGSGIMRLSNIPAGIYYLKNTASDIIRKIVIEK
jgi:hypothetical protein